MLLKQINSTSMHLSTQWLRLLIINVYKVLVVLKWYLNQKVYFCVPHYHFNVYHKLVYENSKGKNVKTMYLVIEKYYLHGKYHWNQVNVVSVMSTFIIWKILAKSIIFLLDIFNILIISQSYFYSKSVEKILYNTIISKRYRNILRHEII